jgi:hypothetical protein
VWESRSTQPNQSQPKATQSSRGFQLRDDDSYAQLKSSAVSKIEAKPMLIMKRRNTSKYIEIHQKYMKIYEICETI